MDFKTLLTKFRQESGLSKKALGLKLGLKNGNYFVEVEKGRSRPPTIERCRQIADALHLEDQDAELLIKSSAEERMEGAEMSILRDNFRKPQRTPLPERPKLDMARRIPIFPKWEEVNQRITMMDVPIGLECVTATNKAELSTYALRIIDECMIPEFTVDDIIIVEENVHPKDGDFVIAADSKGKVPLFRQYRDYGKVKVLHALNPECKEIVLDNEKRYLMVGKIIEKVPKPKLYK